MKQEVQVDSFAVVVADATGVVQSWNAEAQRLFGYSPDEVIGRTLDVIVPDSYRDRHWNGFRGLMDGKDVELDRGAVRIPVRHRDGSTAHCAVRLIALVDPWGRLAGAVGVFAEEPPKGEELPELPEL
jgi:PAS domain S-box-containing protein